MKIRSFGFLGYLFLLVFSFSIAHASTMDDLTSDMILKNPGILSTLEDTLKLHFRNAQIVINEYEDAQYGNRYIIKGIIQGTDRNGMTVRGIALSSDGADYKSGVVKEESTLRIKNPDVSGEPGNVFRGGEYRFIEKRSKKNSYGIYMPEYVYGKLTTIPLSLIQKKANQVRFWDKHAERYLHAIELLIRNSVSNGDYEEAKNYYFNAVNKAIYSNTVIKSWQFRIEDLLKLNEDEKLVLKTGNDLADHFINTAGWNTAQVERDTILKRYDDAIHDLRKAALYMADDPDLLAQYREQAEKIASWLIYEAEVYYDHGHDFYEAYYYYVRAMELKPTDDATVKRMERVKTVVIEELLAVAKEKIKDKEEWGKVEEEVNKVFVIDPDNKKAKQYMKKIGRFKS